MSLPLAGLMLTGLLPASAATGSLRDQVEARLAAEFPAIEAVYRDLHEHPELAFQDVRTASVVAEGLRSLRFDVTEKVGITGVVAVLRNGPGPTVLVRADMDALPIKEETGLPYASRVVMTDLAGRSLPVMHAYGHDLHVASLLGTARVLTALREQWSGTLVMIAQPAEEIGGGAIAMLQDGLFTRFPRPDYALALHVRSTLPAGEIAVVPGLAYANVDSVDILVRGVGGHGARPHSAKDPVVLAAEIILGLQTIISRELEPGTPAVITIGAIHGGTKRNIIPGEVRLELTVRSFDDAVARHLLDSIRRVSENLARASGMSEERLPVITTEETRFPVTYNDPELTHRLAGSFREWFGADRVSEARPNTGGEDFAHYGRTTLRLPISIWAVGCSDPAVIAEAVRLGQPLPANHSPVFRPQAGPTLRASVASTCAAVLNLLGK
jgi:amidohydrolase